MAFYRCKVGNPAGEIVEQILSAPDEEVLRRELEQRDLYIFRIKRKLSLAGALPFWRRKIKIDDFLIFNQELATLIHAGLPVLQSLDILTKRRPKSRFKTILQDVREKVKAGFSLSEAFDMQGGVFPRIYITSLVAGEKSGDLEGMLRRYTRYVRILSSLRKKVLSSIAYPLVLVALSIGLVVILLTYVFPKFSEFYAEFNAQLPLITLTLIRLSMFVKQNLVFIVLIVFIALTFFHLWKRTERGGIFLSRVRLKLPLFGRVWKKYSISQLTRSLATMLHGGIPLVPSLQVASQSVGNQLIAHEVGQVAERVVEGESLSDSLEKTGLMTEMTLEMIQVGEETGSLSEMLNNVSDFYDEEIDNNLNSLISLLEPVLLVVMGLVVAGMLLSMYLPLFRVISAVR